MAHSTTEVLPRSSEFSSLLNVRLCDDSPCIIQAVSPNGLAFELHLGWTTASNSDLSLLCSVSAATHVGLVARQVKIKARSLSIEPNRVSVSLVQGECTSRNAYQRVGFGTDSPVILEIPPFAYSVSIWGANVVTLLGSRRHEVGSISNTPALSIPTAGLSAIRLRVPLGHPYRAVFDLTL